MSSPPVRRLTVSAMHHSRYAMQSLKDWVGRSPIALLGPRSSGRSGVHRALRFMSTAPDDFSIFQLAKDGKSKQIAEVLQRHKIDLSLKDVKGFTLLHYAAMNGHGDVSKLLLESGADPNIQDSVGRTALHYSMPAGFSSCVVHLMNHGANDGIRDLHGLTAADLVSKEGGGEIS
uniref:Uncharacterized protein n=1 Tax=Guillardia theta TaxID=55529 RepID=A0A7S4JBA0_GUITH|mmetsp:Transcript_14765/g.50348  ORF Transcript_14765/g.50348 Transcript_14765/m.50348 type:complete len:175 (+) Transcript_14765:104-628(+)